jgi:hypothetical protein
VVGRTRREAMGAATARPVMAGPAPQVDGGGGGGGEGAKVGSNVSTAPHNLGCPHA